MIIMITEATTMTERTRKRTLTDYAATRSLEFKGVQVRLHPTLPALVFTRIGSPFTVVADMLDVGRHPEGPAAYVRENVLPRLTIAPSVRENVREAESVILI